MLEETQDYVMLLPYKPNDASVQNGYTIISKNWKVFSIEDGFYQYEPSMILLRKLLNTNI